jgi:hypothetical protein
VRIEGAGAALSVAATYLAAGGTPLVVAPSVQLEGFIGGVPLSDFNPDATSPAEAWLTLSTGATTSDTLPAVVMIGDGLAFRGPGGCSACFAEAVRSLVGSPDPGVGSGAGEVALGCLAALVTQRIILGCSEPTGVIRRLDGLPAVETQRCGHRPDSNSA